MIPDENGIGPPGPRRGEGQGLNPDQREVSTEWKTTDRYPAAPQSSSNIMCLACAALSAEEMVEWLGRHIICREEITSRKGGICN